MPTAEQRRLAVLSKLVLEIFPKLFQIILMNVAPPTEYICRLVSKNLQLKSKLHTDDVSFLERMDANTGYSEFSLRLSYTFLRLVPWLEPPAQSWGNTPTTVDLNLSDDIERIRLQANDIITTSDTEVDENVYNATISQFQQITERIKTHFNQEANFVFDAGVLQMMQIDDTHVMILIERLHSQTIIKGFPFPWSSATEVRTRYARLGLIIVEILPNIAREVIVRKIDADFLYRQIVSQNQTNPKEFNKSFTSEEGAKLNTLAGNTYDHIDFTTLYKLIRAYAVLDEPKQGWGNPPRICSLTISDDIERLRIIRNTFVHRITTDITEEQMNTVFSQVEEVSDRVDRYLNKPANYGFKCAVRTLRTCQIDSEREERYVQTLRDIERVQERFAVNNIHFHYGTSFKDFIEGVRTMANNETKQIKMVMEVTLTNEQLRTVNEKRDAINSGQLWVKLEIAEAESLVLHVRVNDAVMTSDSKLAEALSSFIQMILQFASVDVNDSTRMNVVLVREDDCNEIGLVLDDVGLESCFDDFTSPGELQLPLNVESDLFVSQQRLRSELGGVVERDSLAIIPAVITSQVDVVDNQQKHALDTNVCNVDVDFPADNFEEKCQKERQLLLCADESKQNFCNETLGYIDDNLPEASLEEKRQLLHSDDSIVKDLSDVSVIEGGDAHFEIWTKQQNLCSIWSKDGTELVNSDKFMCKMFGSIHLDIKNISLSDKGRYTVKVNGIERKGCLHVTEYFTKNPQRIECIEGETCQFICEVVEDGFPACWSKNGTYLKNDQKYKMLQFGNVHSLSILQCGLHDAGDYTVSINNRVRTTFLVVKEYFTQNMDRTYECIEGDTLELACEVLDSNAAAMWEKEGFVIQKSAKYKLQQLGTTHKLSIVSAELHDAGSYKVNIANRERLTSIKIKEFPAAIRPLSREDKDLYLEIIKSGKETRYYIRVVIIGENGVGKTCLLRRLLGDSIEDVETTDGIDIVHRCKIKLHDGKWVIDKGTDKRRDLIIRLKRALSARTSEYINIGKKEENLEGIPPHSYTTTTDTPLIGRNTIPEVTQNKPDTSKANTENKVCRQTTEATAENIELPPCRQPVQFQTTEETPESKPVKVISENILNEISDFINDLEKYDIPKEVLVDCGFWDFAGQKHYYPTHPVFLNSNALHLLVADIMKDIKQISTEGGYDKIGEYIDFWFDNIHSCGACDSAMDSTREYLNPPVIVVCTHIDKCQTTFDERKNEFRKQLLSLLHNEDKQKHLRRICYLSNKEPTEEDFDYLRRSIFEFGKKIQTFGETIPLRWIRLEQSLVVLQDAGVNMLSWSDITDVSSKSSIDDENEINLFLKYQHNVGNVIYYECLKEFIILNQKWLSDAFRCLVSDKYDDNLQLTQEWKILEETGELKHSLIIKLFNKDPDKKFYQHVHQLLRVMEMFGIIVKPTTLKENGQNQKLSAYFMPCMISRKSSIMQLYELFGVKQEYLSPWLCIQFEFMPFDFFNHIFGHYARQYAICTEAVSRRIALYHGMGVFFYDNTKLRKFVLCFSKNTIAIQMWQWRKLQVGGFKSMLEEMKSVVHNMKYKYEPRQVSFTVKIKCAHGSLHVVAGRQSYKELTNLGDKEYFCEEHNEVHDAIEIFQTWFEDYSEDEEKEPALNKCKAESAIASPPSGDPGSHILSIIRDEEMFYARISEQRSKKINRGSQNQRFNQKCHVCHEDPPVCWCHECQKPMCNHCHNSHSDSDDNSLHILQHIDDMYALDSKFKVDASLVTDLKVLNNGLLVIADWNGKRLVTCQITRPEQYTIALPGDPYRLAVVDEHTVAVTLPIISTVVIVNVRERKVLKHIRTNVAAGGIMFKDGQLFIGIEKAIKIIDIPGAVKHIMPVGNVSNYICGGEAGSIFYTDLDKLYCIDSKGNTLFTFTDPSMRMPRAITTDDEGHLLVLCEKSNNIFRVSPDGKLIIVIIAQIPMHSWSPFMCYDTISQSVIICRDKTVYLYKKL